MGTGEGVRVGLGIALGLGDGVGGVVGQGVGLEVLVAVGVFDGLEVSGDWPGLQPLTIRKNVNVPKINQYRFKVSPRA